MTVAGISRASVKSNHGWTERFRLPYALLSDPDGAVSRAFGVMRPVKLGGWTIELSQRATFLVDRAGIVAAVWKKVKVRGHAIEVLGVVDALQRSPG